MPNTDSKRTLELLSSSISGLLALKWMQATFGLVWAVLIVGRALFGLDVLGTLIIVLLPFAITACAAWQARRSQKAADFYTLARDDLVAQRLDLEQRKQALRLVNLYQRYSQPPFIKGNSSRSLAVGLLIGAIAISMVIVILL